MTLTRLLVKASFIAKFHRVHAVDNGLRDRHTDGFALDKAIVKASFIAKVHTVHSVNAGLDWVDFVRLHVTPSSMSPLLLF